MAAQIQHDDKITITGVPIPHWSGGNTTTAVALWEGFMYIEDKRVGLGDVGVDYMGGYVGAYACMAWWADCIDWVLSEVDPDTNFPGVFEYEVVEPFGTWLRGYVNKPTEHLHTHTMAAFDGLSRAHLASLMAKFFGVEQDTGDPDDMSQGEFLLRFSAKLQEWADAYPGNRHW